MDRFTWGVVAGTVVLVVAGLVAVLVLQRSPAPPDLSQPEGVVRAYVEALDAGRPDEAWALLGERQQAQVPRDEFVRLATTRYRSSREGRLVVDAVTVEGGTARVDLSRTYSSGSGPFGLFGPSTFTSRTTARLELQGGRWRITVPPEPYFLPVPAPPPDRAIVVVTPTPAPTPVPTLAPGTP